MTKDAKTVIAVGIDTARYGHHVTFLSENCEFAIEPFVFMESAEGYGLLDQAIANLEEANHPVVFQVRVDAAGQYANNLQHPRGPGRRQGG